MNTLNELQRANMLLRDHMIQDTALSLAMTAAWLDPVHFSPVDYEDGLFGHEEDPEALTRLALNLARQFSTRLYMELCQGLRYGWTFHQLDRAFCTGLNKLCSHLELDSLYDSIYGVPLHICGIRLDEPETFAHCADAVMLLDDFFELSTNDVQDDNDPSNSLPAITRDSADAGEKLARPIIDSLVAQERQPYADIALFLMYLFSDTGSSLLDLTEEDHYDCGFDPVLWDSDGIAFANSANLEVQIVRDATLRATTVLQTEHDIIHALQANIATAQTALERNETHARFTWPARSRPRRYPTSYQRATGPNLALVFVRDCYGKTDASRQD